MKKFINKLSNSIKKRFNRWGKKLYFRWLKTKIKKIDKTSLISYPNEIIGEQYISVGKNVKMGKRGVLTAWDNYRGVSFSPKITIGDNTFIGDDFHITAINKIEIGNFVLMGKKITITDNSHGNTSFEMLKTPPIYRPLISKGSVVIEDNVWIGDKATILPNVRIGKNAIVGANAVVAKDVPANCVVAGVPAVIIKEITGA